MLNEMIWPARGLRKESRRCEEGFVAEELGALGSILREVSCEERYEQQEHVASGQLTTHGLFKGCGSSLRDGIPKLRCAEMNIINAE